MVVEVVDSVCIDVFNQSAEALRRIKAEINRFERYLEQKIKSYAKLELESEKPSSSIDKLIGSMSHVAIRELFREIYVVRSVLKTWYNCSDAAKRFGKT